ncbi:MAG: GerMN domain-containing protein, partial [Actinobacteria bacterium]|nr:GerMN domain-containing protein [Actinomycetota bacterium]
SITDPASGSASGSGPTTAVALYLTQGDTLHRIVRSVPKVAGIGAATLRALLAGPTPEEAKSGVGTAVPSGTRLLGLTIEGGVARVDLSRQFEVTGNEEAVTLSLAQVTCTLGQFDTVKGVRFALDGKDVSVLSGDGTVTDRPLTCDRYGRFEPAPKSPDPGIWPYTSAEESDAAVAGGDRTFLDPVAAAREFATRYLGMVDPFVFDFAEGGPGDGEVGIGFRYSEGRTPVANPKPTTSVVVRQLGRRGDSGAWTVTAAWSPNIEVSEPQPLSRVSSPLPLTGRASAFEGHVNVSVREDAMVAGASLGEGFVTGRGDGELGPFSGHVAFRSPSKPAGAVVFSDRSAADGQMLRATVVRVTFGP